MKRDPVPRTMKMLVQCVSRWLVVAAFAGIGHATASAAGGQIDNKGQHKPMQPQSMVGCDACAACQLAPGFEANTTGSSDQREQLPYAASMWQPDERYKFRQYMPTNAVLPDTALLIRYCRWLN